MCAILDANVAHEVFTTNQTEAGRAFLCWLTRRQGRLVVGGKLRLELARHRAAERWIVEGIRAGRVRVAKNDDVDRLAEELAGSCRSDDPHIIALARISGARLLYSNDRALHQDFGNRDLLTHPRGKVFSTSETPRLTEVHQKLLNRADLCRRAD
ncbi:MAG: hypothetical protein OXC25_10495 [Thiotrichales bacterium]|nr:hypothetical protein [Thiotrichales bacterium]MCY4284197.1 hypothetical protein [Thiotrichales bacterium]MCY4350260.1 hypothetical protein [Thiotrichales bacterium]